MSVFSTNNFSERMYEAGDKDASCMIALYKAAWALECAVEAACLDVSQKACSDLIDALDNAQQVYKLSTGKDLVGD